MKQPDSIQIVCEKLIDAIRGPLEYEGSVLYVTASIGVAIYSQHNDNVNQLIEQADAAMYQAKQFGKNQWRHYLHASN